MKAVTSIIRSQTAITSLLADAGDSVFINMALRDAAYPYIVLDDRLLEGYKSKEFGSDFKKMQYFIKIFSSSYSVSRQISDALEAELDKKTPGTYNGEVLTSLYLEETESYQADIENKTTFVIEHEYQGIVRR